MGVPRVPPLNPSETIVLSRRQLKSLPICILVAGEQWGSATPPEFEIDETLCSLPYFEQFTSIIVPYLQLKS